MLYSSGLKTLPSPGSIIGVELNMLPGEKGNDKLLNDYKPYYKQENTDQIKSEYNSKFDEFLLKAVKNIDFIAELPDLQEEYLN